LTTTIVQNEEERGLRFDLLFLSQTLLGKERVRRDEAAQAPRELKNLKVDFL
jgi:hypothetical protein